MSLISSKNSKKDLILAAAVQIFSQKGYHLARMEEIAAAAGIGKGTIYEYFTSKLQLLQEIIKQSFQLYNQTVSADVLNTLSLEAKLKLLMKSHLKFCQDNKDLTRIIFWDTDIMDIEIRDWSLKMRAEKEQLMQSLIESGIKNGEIRSVDSKLLTVMISGIMGAMWIPLVIEDWDIDISSATDQVIDIVMQGIKK